MITMAAIQDALKNYYIDAIRHQMNYGSTALAAQLEKTSKNIVGDKITRYLRYGRNGGVGNRADDGTMPTPGSRKGFQITTGTKNMFGSLQITSKSIKASKGNKASFINQLTTNLEELLTDAKDNFGRQLYGDGEGILALATAAGSSGAVVKVADADSLRYLYEGMRVDVLDAATKVTKRADALEVASIDKDAGTITLESAVGSAVTDNDVICVQGSYGLELTGMEAIFNKSTIYGVDRSAMNWMKPNIINVGASAGSTAELDELKIQEGLDEIEIATGESANFMIGSYGVRRAYQYLFLSSKRTVNTLKLEGGFTALDYNGTPFTADRYYKKGTLDLINTKSLTLDRLDDWGWADEDGNMLHRMTSKAAYEAVLECYGDLMCDLMKSNTRLQFITQH